MQKLRNKFRRKQPPTIPIAISPQTDFEESSKILENAINCKLGVPSPGRQIRSSSCDHIHLKNEETDTIRDRLPFCSSEVNLAVNLSIPTTGSRSSRSKSFDCTSGKKQAGKLRSTPGSIGFLEIPKWKLLIRRSSSQSTDRDSNLSLYHEKCVHCSLIEELGNSSVASSMSSLGSSVAGDRSESDISVAKEDDEQEFITCRANSLNGNSEFLISPEEGLPLVTLSAAPEFDEFSPDEEDLGNGITVISLEVPVVRQTRSASIDGSLLKVPERPDLQNDNERPPSKSQRSHSVDICLPIKPNGPYLVLQPSKPTPVFRKKAIQGEIKISTENGETRTLRSAPDWGETAINGDHLWVSTSASGDLCYVGENECSKQGPRLCCPACKITAHTGCIGILIDKIKFHCKPTFKDVGVRQYREQTVIHHHWVHRRHQKGRCRQCGKSFQSKLSFGNKEIVALGCSWCKTNFHNKETCFCMERLTETCNLGIHSDLIIPPSWIVKLPRKGSFKSSIRRSPKNKRSSSKRRSKKEDNSTISVSSEYSQHLPVHPILPLNSGSSSPPPDTKTPISIAGGQHRSFTIKPIPCPNSKPLLVFINPKSGGNQGSKLMQKFQWLLNPRQVFDLTQGGPKPGLELYKKVPNLRILACGGDGTAGWILSMLDDIGIYPNPPLAVLPLGTGNDLARALGWGGGYTDEPVSKILLNIQDGEVVQLDRWDLKVTRNNDAPVCDPSEAEGAKDDLPLNVVNNYFSVGVDAHIALEFHEAREAHPERFNSRLRNKMFYGQAGGKDLLQRKWKDLHNYISLECDGVDLTQRLRDLKIHSLLFLNIPSYGGGTRPWGTNSPSFETPRTDDGLIEVIGLTTYQLPLLQAGGHGSCIAQCRSARIITSRTIPMQVDGEPCRLLPAIIELQLRNQANMIAKAKSHTQITHIPLEREVTLEVRKLNLSDYETYHYDKEKLKEVSLQLGKLTINPDLELDRVRAQINVMVHGTDYPCVDVHDSEAKLHRIESNFALSADWCFVDSCTAERFFRIDRAQEHLHYVVDICNDDLFILDPADDLGKEETANTLPNCLAESQPDNANLQSLSRLNESNNNSILLCPPAESSDDCKSMESDTNDNKSGSQEMQMSNVATPVCSANNSANVSDNESKAMKSNNDEKRNDDNRHREDAGDAAFNTAPLKPVRVEKVSTEIIEAAKRGDVHKIKALLEEGYSLLAIDENGMTALHYAAKYGFDEVVQLVVREEHSIIDIPDCEEGQTALHKAAKYGRRKTCCILAAAGCSLTKIDNEGFTAKQLALQSRDNELAAYLQHFENYQNTLRDKETTV